MDEPLQEMPFDAARLLNAVGGVLWEFDWPSGAFTFVAGGYESLLGFPREAWLRPGFWLARLHPEDRDAAVEYCRAATEEGRDHAFEYRMVRADGGIVWVRDVVTVDPASRFEGPLRGVLIDITDTMRRAEQYDAVFRLMRDLFFRVDSRGVIVEYSAPDDQALYVPPNVFLHRPLVDVLPPDAADLLRRYTAEALETGRMAVGEYSLTMDGVTTDWEARVLPLNDGETAVVCRDITDRKRQQSELDRQRDGLDEAFTNLLISEERFRSFVDRAPFGIHMYEVHHGRLLLTQANAAADGLLGIDHEPLIGMTMQEAFPALREQAALYHHLAEQGGEWSGELFYGNDGAPIVLDVTAFQTTRRQVAAMFADITDRKRMEEAEREHNQRVSALAARIAAAEDLERQRLAEELHDRVSQPLAVARMRLTSGMSTCEHRPEDATQALDMLERAIAETRSITTELYPPVLRELGLAAALEWLSDEYCRTHGLCCTTRYDDVRGHLSAAVEAALFRAARELLMNVIKHAGTDEAWVSLDLLGDRVALTVADEGSGFDPELHGPTSLDAGFGLFSIAERVRHLGGTIDVESEPGEGVRVTVTLPVEP